MPVPERRRTTIRELADYTGLSPAAVSYALRGLQVSAETQQRVRDAAFQDQEASQQHGAGGQREDRDGI